MLRIARRSDGALIEIFLGALSQGMIDKLTASASSGAAIAAVTDADNIPEILETIKQIDAGVLLSIAGSKGGFTVTVKRSDGQAFDELHDSWNQSNGTLPDLDRVKCYAHFTAALVDFNPSSSLLTGQDIDQVAETQLAHHVAMHDRLEKLQTTLSETTARFLGSLEDQAIKVKEKLQEEFDEKDKKLAAEYKETQEKLEEKSRLLDERESEIDALDNTAARRQIRRDILEELGRRADKFGLTRGTRLLRLPIHIMCVSVVSLAAAGAISFSMELPTDFSRTSDLVLFAKPIGLTFIAVATSIFYIRWMNRWFEQHASAEFKLKQLQLDVERAGWIVETALDWENEEGRHIPDELLLRLSANLFGPGHDEIREAIHPSDELASALLGTASKVKLNLAGNELELDTKKLQRASASTPPS